MIFDSNVRAKERENGKLTIILCLSSKSFCGVKSCSPALDNMRMKRKASASEDIRVKCQSKRKRKWKFDHSSVPFFFQLFSSQLISYLTSLQLGGKNNLLNFPSLAIALRLSIHIFSFGSIDHALSLTVFIFAWLRPSLPCIS